MADLVKYTMDDGTEVYFESAEGEGLVGRRGGKPTVEDGGPIADRLEPVAKAAGVVSRSLRSQLRPDEITVEFGVKVSGEVNWWFEHSPRCTQLAATGIWDRLASCVTAIC